VAPPAWAVEFSHAILQGSPGMWPAMWPASIRSSSATTSTWRSRTMAARRPDVTAEIVRIACPRLGIELIATHDAHYLTRHDVEATTPSSACSPQVA